MLKIHIEAPVEKVFKFWANPGNWRKVVQTEYTLEELVVSQLHGDPLPRLYSKN